MDVSVNHVTSIDFVFDVNPLLFREQVYVIRVYRGDLWTAFMERFAGGCLPQVFKVSLPHTSSIGNQKLRKIRVFINFLAKL